MTPIRLLLADDHPVVLEGFRSLLERDFHVVGCVQNGHALLAAAQKLQPDVVITDIGMPLLNGLDAAGDLKKTMPRLKIIFLTVHQKRAYVAAAFRAGASAYLLKHSEPTELAFAIREVMKNRTYVTPLVATDVVGSFLESPHAAPPDDGPSQLSFRQREVLQLLAEGHTTKEIAKILAISVKTIDCHKAQIKRQLNLYTTAALTKYAIEHGLVNPEPEPGS